MLLPPNFCAIWHILLARNLEDGKHHNLITIIKITTIGFLVGYNGFTMIIILPVRVKGNYTG